MWRAFSLKSGRMEEIWLEYPNIKTAQWAAGLLNGRSLGAIWNIEAEARSSPPRSHILRLYPTHSMLWLNNIPRACSEAELRRWLQPTNNATIISIRFIFE
jgi:hypothetical protein